MAFYPATGQTSNRMVSKEIKLSASHADVAETHAVLSRGFRKVSGPRLHKPLTLNGTQPPQIFRVQAKISTVRPVFPDYLSVSYDYD